MRKLCLLLLSSLVSFLYVPAQKVGINDDNSDPHSSAMLHVQSATKGLLVPRMTALQRTQISSPANGLLVYQTDGLAGFYYYQEEPQPPNWLLLAAANSVWSLNGNSGTTASNFIGTIDDQPLLFKVSGVFSGRISASTDGNQMFGYQAGAGITTGKWNTLTGYQAGAGITEGFQNASHGYQALMSNTTGASNAAFGYRALLSNNNGNGNVGVGFNTLVINTGGSENVALGGAALFLNTTGSGNTATGFNSLLKNETGSFNTGLGYRTEVFATNLTNATAIGANARVDCNNCLVLGSINAVNGATATARVGIGTSDPVPSAILHLKSTTAGFLAPRMTQVERDVILNPATGLLVYQTDGTPGFYYFNGTAWTALSSGGASSVWSLSGNAGTNPATNFIGTTDNQPLIFKANNLLAGQVHSRLIATANNNVSFGLGALLNTVFDPNQPALGNFNVAIGNEALFYNTTGSHNVAVGMSALTANTEGYQNTASGSYALQSNTSGFGNTAMGYTALSLSKTGNNNTALGGGALYTNISGSQNTAVGTSALKLNMEGDFNTAVGYTALYSNTASNNTAVGNKALFSNSSGSSNTATGTSALEANTTGNSNTAVGISALKSNQGTSQNTAVGFGALFNNKADNNNAFGSSALSNNSLGTNNVAVGNSAMSISTHGNGNTAVGNQALAANTNGHNNTAIGYQADVSGTSLTNATAIGYGAVVSLSNTIQLGNGSVSAVNSSGSFNTTSDGRFKYNVREDVRGLDFILKLRPVTYQFDVQRLEAYTRGEAVSDNYVIPASYYEANAIRRTGFIAQEVEKAAEETRYDFNGVNKPKTSIDHYSLSYASFVVPLVKAVQEQQQQIAELRQQIHKLEQENKEFRKLNEQVEQLVKALQTLSANR